RFGAARVVGIDADPAQIERARARTVDLADRAEFQVADAAALPFPAERFDAVFEFAVLHHVVGWRQALGEIARVLVPGGRFYFEDLQKRLVLSRPFRALFDHPKDAQFEGYEFFGALRAAGLSLIGEPTIVRGAFLAGVARKGSHGSI